MVDKRVAYRVLVERSDGRRSLGIPRRTWKDNIKLDREEVGWRCIDGIYLAQDRNKWLCL
jgi:hypothetical protein